MRRYFLIIWTVILLISCSTSYTTVKHVAPKNRNRYYSVKKDKHRKRTKIVKKKIVNQRNVVRKGPKTKKKVLPDPETPKTNESDTTGFSP